MSAYRARVLSLSPAVYYRCESTSALVDETGILGGTLVGAESTPGADGSGLAFTGQHGSSYGSVPDGPPTRHGPDGLTVSAWIRASAAPPNGRYLLCKYWGGATAGWALQSTGSALNVYARGHSAVGLAGVYDGAWHHVALALEPSGSVWSARIYLDGQLAGTRLGALSGGEPSGTSPVFLARRGDGDGAACALDEIALWPRALSGPEVALLAEIPAGRARRVLTPSGLVPVTRRVLTASGLVALRT